MVSTGLLGLGLLTVVLTLPAVLWPQPYHRQFTELIARDGFLRGGIVPVGLLALLCLSFAWGQAGVGAWLLFGLGLVYVPAMLVIWFRPAAYRHMVLIFAKTPQELRAICAMKLVVGGALISWGIFLL